jgi:carboxynorspermidine decarboxylase
VCTSGLWEAKLAAEHYRGEIATYCAAYKGGRSARNPRLVRSCDLQFAVPDRTVRARAGRRARRGKASTWACGSTRSTEGEVPRYDPCAPHSRLGFPVDQLTPEHLEGVSGLHFHTLCEQDFEPLERTWEALKPRIAPFFGQLKWLNFGGGHHVTRADYQRDDLVAFLKAVKAETGCEIYLEPGEAVALDAGILVGTVLDRHWNGMDIAITDISATCHMPDVIEAPYRPAMLGERPIDEYEGTDGADAPVRLGGPSCLAGDVIGDYRLPVRAEPGVRFAFLDQAHYSMVKTTTFNGCRCLRSGSGTVRPTRSNACGLSPTRISATASDNFSNFVLNHDPVVSSGGRFCARTGHVCAGARPAM